MVLYILTFRERSRESEEPEESTLNHLLQKHNIHGNNGDGNYVIALDNDGRETERIDQNMTIGQLARGLRVNESLKLKAYRTDDRLLIMNAGHN